MANIDYNIRYRTIRLTYANKEEMDFLIEKNVLTYQNLFKDQPIVNIRYGNAEFAEKLRELLPGAELIHDQIGGMVNQIWIGYPQSLQGQILPDPPRGHFSSFQSSPPKKKTRKVREPKAKPTKPTFGAGHEDLMAEIEGVIAADRKANEPPF